MTEVSAGSENKRTHVMPKDDKKTNKFLYEAKTVSQRHAIFLVSLQ